MSDKIMNKFLQCGFAMGLAVFVSQSLGQDLVARSQLRRTVDSSVQTVYGTVFIEKTASGKQEVFVQVSGLGEENFYVALGTNSPFYTTNSLENLIAPLNRAKLSTGAWNRTLVGNGAAPLELQQVDVGDVTELAGRYLTIGQPGTDLLVQNTVFTNVVNGITNILTTTFIPLPPPSVTNGILDILWAPIPTLSAHPSASSFNRKINLTRPGPPSPSPKAIGTLKTRFNNAAGESRFEVRISHMTKGQTYSVWIANDATAPTALIQAGDVVMTTGGSSGAFIRDTRYGDPMPQEYGNPGELSGRVIQIRDAFDVIHLDGIIP